MNFGRKISPKLKKTANLLTFTVVEPTAGDWLIVATICALSLPLAWYTTKEVPYAMISTIFYWGLAYTMIDDKFVTTIDKKKNVVQITKSKVGRTKWIRESIADEMINVQVVEVKSGRTCFFRLDLEFMSEYGYYKLETSETTVKGDANKQELEKMALAVRKFMDLKPLPVKFTEESLRKTMPTSMKKIDRDSLRGKLASGEK